MFLIFPSTSVNQQLSINVMEMIKETFPEQQRRRQHIPELHAATRSDELCDVQNQL